MSERFDVIVVGSGSAGLATALAARGLQVAVITRGVLGLDGASCWAQGGIAAALGPGDSPAQHALDTINCGARLNNKTAVRWMAEMAPEVVAWLHGLGAQFDTYAGRLALGREGAHSFPRVIHAGGDATGAEVMRALRQTVQQASNIKVFEFVEVDRLLKFANAVVGIAGHSVRGESLELFAPQVVLATGGLGQLYRYTTNPIECDGSGIALAQRAGAELADMEFVQFHPTALAPRTDQRNEPEQLPLITEALRGAGARLLNNLGERFMAPIHAQGELAPRDIVSRAVWAQIEAGRQVYLDARGLGDAVRARFPTVFSACINQGVDPRREPIPVVPAAHYHMGGVRVDLHSQTTVAGLFAVGEVSCTGVHGANRLASNSVLEAVAFGRTLGERLARQGQSSKTLRADPSDAPAPSRAASVNDAMVYAKLKTLMWSCAGVVRTPESLRQVVEQIQVMERRCTAGSRIQGQLITARLIAEAALARTQSIGAHFLIPEAAKRSHGSWSAVA